MDKIKVYDEFLKSLRIAITNSSVYFKEHPILISSIENLKKAIEEVFLLQDSLTIGIAANYLLFGSERLENKRLYSEIIIFFHRRKIKNIEIKKGVSIEELLGFLSEANLSSRDILRRGGLDKILKEKDIADIIVESLDYSQLLKGEGEEFKDVWLYLLGQGLKQGDNEQIESLTADFEKVAAKFDAQDLLDDEGKEAIIAKLLNYLKDKDKKKFIDCSKSLAKSVLKTDHLAKDVDADKLKQYFAGLTADDVSDILLEQLSGAKEVRSLNFNLFSKLIDDDKHKEAANSLQDKLKKGSLKNNRQVVSKMKELFSLPDDSYVSQIYQRNLSSMLEGVSLGQGISFDHTHLQKNYSLILLELFSSEVDPKRLVTVLDKIFIELHSAIEKRDVKYVEDFMDILEKKLKEIPSLVPILGEAEKKVSSFIERSILEQGQSQELECFIDKLNNSALKINDYFDLIFQENRVNSTILKLFFKFFSSRLDLFYERLNHRIGDVGFIEKLIESLKEIKSILSLEILKRIFSLSNNFIKIEALKAMQHFDFCDDDFLFFLLKNKDAYQRKYALMVLARSSKSKKEAAKLLLSISNPLGFRTRVIEENLKIVSDTEFKEAKEFLHQLTQYKFFWNKRIREKARKIIEKYES